MASRCGWFRNSTAGCSSDAFSLPTTAPSRTCQSPCTPPHELGNAPVVNFSSTTSLPGWFKNGLKSAALSAKQRTVEAAKS